MTEIERRARPSRLLQAKTYSLNVAHAFTTVDGAGVSVAHTETVQIDVTVQLDRFLPVEVGYRHPLPGSSGNFSDIVPHIVLNHGSLPFERTASSEGAERTRDPWLALIILPAATSEPRTGTVRDLFAPARDRIGYAKEAPATDDEAKLPCRYIDLKLTEFAARAPSAEVLAKLAHVQVSADGAPTSVILHHNPVKTLPGIAAGKAELRACLVSLERLKPKLCSTLKEQRNLPYRLQRNSPDKRSHLGPRRPANTPDTIRLMVLNDWCFTHDPAAPEFKGQEFNQTVGRLLTPWTLSKEKHDAAALSALASIDRVRFGANGEAAKLYHGPLVTADPASATQSQADRINGEYFQATVNGQEVFDISYAVAFQYGRFVGLTNGEVGAPLLAWRDAINKLTSAPGAASNLPTPPKAFKERLGAGAWLEIIPLHYLFPSGLPDEALLPFHVDGDWLAAFLAGLCSLGQKGGGKADPGPLMRERLRNDLALDGAMTGLLLRSELLNKWPETKLLGHVRGAAAAPLATVALAADTTIVLYKGVVGRLEIHPPVTAQQFSDIGAKFSNELQNKDSTSVTAANKSAAASHPVAIEIGAVK